MDILKPELVWISGRCYRVNAEHNTDATGPDVLEENDFCGMGTFFINYIIFSKLLLYDLCIFKVMKI